MNVALPPKPKFRAPCNGCGLCCSIELCAVGVLAFPGAQAPCPALKISTDGTRTYCNIVATEIEKKMEPIIQTYLGIGYGCSMTDPDTTGEEITLQDREYRQKLAEAFPGL